MSGPRRSVCYAATNTGESVELRGGFVGLFFIHHPMRSHGATWREDKNLWRITHGPTGLRISDHHTKAIAVAIAERLMDTGLPWGQTAEQIRRWPKAKKALVRKVLEGSKANEIRSSD